MAYKPVCDRCGSVINPKSSKIVVGYDIDCWGDAKEQIELCVSCAFRLKQWLNGEEGGGGDG